jgi:hypothetical protein
MPKVEAQVATVVSSHVSGLNLWIAPLQEVVLLSIVHYAISPQHSAVQRLVSVQAVGNVYHASLFKSNKK